MDIDKIKGIIEFLGNGFNKNKKRKMQISQEKEELQNYIKRLKTSTFSLDEIRRRCNENEFQKIPELCQILDLNYLTS
jgi:stalled ribosome rescue protein Dom34